MNSRQLNVYATNDDFVLLSEALEKVDDFVAVNAVSSEGDPVTNEGLSLVRRDSDPLEVFLVRIEDVGDIRWSPLTIGKRFIDVVRSPAIQFVRCNYDGASISRGRLYYVRSYVENGEECIKSNGFDTWASEVFGITRKVFAKRVSPYYLGPKADELVASGVQLRP